MRLVVFPAAPVVLAVGMAACGQQGPSNARSPSVAPLSTGPWVVDFQDGTDLETARIALQDGTVEWFHPRAADDAIVVMETLTPSQHDRLANHPSLEVLEPSLPFETLGYPNDPMRDRQWNLDRVHAETGWRLSQGRGAVVAVIDTGVSNVPDLAGTTLLEGVSFVIGEPSVVDGNGHGTHVAGTIAQTTHNGLGVAGVAPEATILPLKALAATGGGRSEWVAAAIDEAGDQGAHIINLSLGGPQSAVIARAVEKAQKRGLLVIAAAGNTGREGVGSPAALPGVIAVSATGPTDEKAPYSTFGPEVMIAAPGGDKRSSGGGILQDTVDPGSEAGHAFKEFQGTSMATPHVAGAAAIVHASTAGGPGYIGRVLTETALDLGEPGRDLVYGHGRLDLDAAVRRVVLQERGGLFATAGILAALLAGGFGPRRGRRRVVVTAALVAGGVFFLPLLPIPPTGIAELLSRPLLMWADVILGTGWSRSMLVLSAALPVGLTFVLGPTRTLGPWVAGLSSGIGTHLLVGGLTGCLSVAALPGPLSAGWLILNGMGALVCAVATLGVQRLSEQSGGDA